LLFRGKHAGNTINEPLGGSDMRLREWIPFDGIAPRNHSNLSKLLDESRHQSDIEHDDRVTSARNAFALWREAGRGHEYEII
jgi:hypothetical protein